MDNRNTDNLLLYWVSSICGSCTGKDKCDEAYCPWCDNNKTGYCYRSSKCNNFYCRYISFNNGGIGYGICIKNK